MMKPTRYCWPQAARAEPSPFRRRLLVNAAVAATAATIALPGLATDAEILSAEQIRLGYQQHAALAQLHRWYQIYENRMVPIKNSLDILTPEVTINSISGTAQGHKAYLAVVETLPQTHQNAHYVQQATVTPNADGRVSIQAQVEYANLGALSDGGVRAVALTYDTKLVPTDTVLPRFSEITIKAAGVGKITSFSDAYPENRTKSLLHYYLALIEDPRRDLAPFKEILANEFSLNFSGSPITDWTGFEKWFRGPASSVEASTHQASNIRVNTTSKNTFEMMVDLDWQGILPDGREMVAKTRHRWVVADNPADRFARIKSVEVEILKPFRPRKE